LMSIYSNIKCFDTLLKMSIFCPQNGPDPEPFCGQKKMRKKSKNKTERKTSIKKVVVLYFCATH
jgi:hypothetical protein